MAFTFFFRDLPTLEEVVALSLPEIENRRSFKIWDAGCAMGPEPYTLLILFAEKLSSFAFKKISLDASDYDAENGKFGEIIRKGVYPYEVLKRIPKAVLDKYFVKIDEENYQISDVIKARLKFHKHDLTSLKPIGNAYNLIICKNVLLHIPPPVRIKVYKMFWSVLEKNGILATEQTQPLPEEVSNLFEPENRTLKIFRKKL